jgi:hypothetical protein
MTTLIWIVAAFALYIVVFPLVGFLIGFFIRTVVPYLFGTVALLIPVTEIIGIGVALLWAAVVLGSRQVLNRKNTKHYPWYEGHCQAISNLFSFARHRAV